MANSCCNNPTLAYRSDNDKAMIKTYCTYANSAPTSFYKNYGSSSVKESFCAGASCGDSNPNGYWSLGSAYGPKPGAYAACKEGFEYQKVLANSQFALDGAAPIVRENYCSCTAGCASLPYNGSTQYGFVGQSGSDYPAPCARKYSATRNMPAGI